MYTNLIRIIIAVLVAIVVGNICHPDGPVGSMVVKLFRDRDEKVLALQREAEAARQARLKRLEEARKLIRRERPKSVEVVEEDAGDWDVGFVENDDKDVSGDDEVATTEEDGGFADSSSFMLGDTAAKLFGIVEDKDAPDVEGQTGVVPTPLDSGKRNAMLNASRKLELQLSRAEGKTKEKYVNDEYDSTAWKKPGDIYLALTERMQGKLGSKPTTSDVCKFLENPANRLDLARYSLIRQATVRGATEVAEMPMGSTFLAALGSDLEWITNVMYSGPTDRLSQGLKYMAVLYARYAEDMGDPIVRRIATTTAMEFAREGWPEEHMLKRFAYYNSSYRQGKLNKLFDTLRYWETRLVTGHKEYSGWGSPASLEWQRDNVRLPLEGYLSASNQMVYRLRNVAGDSVFSSEYLAPYQVGAANITAKAHRDIGGVCGACSHYGAYGALAAGLPAMTMGEPGHCAFTVRVGDQWRKGYSIYWQHSMHKTFWGMHDWEFLILTQQLYGAEYYKTLTSDQLRAAAEFLAARKLTASAISCFDAATVTQPLNWPVWLSYAGYLAQKAPQDKTRWKELSERVTNTMGEKYHDAAATMLARYIYPQLLPLVPDSKERNKIFTSFFRQCKTYGIHTWNLSTLLNAQLASCSTDKEKMAYMKEVLPNLMSKPDFSGAVLAWGLDVVSSLTKEGEEESSRVQEDFSKMITSAMKRMGSGKKDRDATWAGLGQAIDTAATNGDTRTFQAIGKMAKNKCKNYFPKHKFKIRPFPGKVVSAKGLITTATTLDEGGVKRSCLHWGVLQKEGGSIPIKFEGKSGIVVKLEGESDLTGTVILFGNKIKDDRPFYLESSTDGRNWSAVVGKPVIEGTTMRFDLKESHASGRYIRLLREGDKWDSGSIIGFYVYGRPHKA